jgi:Saxitoxin biosynthesis operon protein SxtJ
MKFNRKHIETIIVLTIALAALGWFTKKQQWYWVAVIFAIVALAVPPLAKYIHMGWMKLAQAIGFVMNKVLLTVVFIVIVIPLGILSRITGKNSIRLQKDATSYFKTRNHTYTKADLENMW